MENVDPNPQPSPFLDEYGICLAEQTSEIVAAINGSNLPLASKQIAINNATCILNMWEALAHTIRCNQMGISSSHAQDLKRYRPSPTTPPGATPTAAPAATPRRTRAAKRARHPSSDL